MREKYTYIGVNSTVKIEENKIVSFDKNNNTVYSFRVGKDGFLGVHYQEGEMSDEEGYARAEQNLELKRPYPFELETGERSRDKRRRCFRTRSLWIWPGRRWSTSARNIRTSGWTEVFSSPGWIPDRKMTAG